jgi:hypothetical protein
MLMNYAIGIWLMRLLDHGRCHCCRIIWKVTVVVAATAICWIRECEVEEAELLLNAPWKRESMKVELW